MVQTRWGVIKRRCTKHIDGWRPFKLLKVSLRAWTFYNFCFSKYFHTIFLSKSAGVLSRNMAEENMTIENGLFNEILIILKISKNHTFLHHHGPSSLPICLFVFFQYPMELSILVVMQICIKMGPINSQLLVYHHSEILKKCKCLHKFR